MASTSRQPDRVASETVDGEDVKVRLYLDVDHPEYEARVDLERDERWTWGIDDDGVASLLTTTAGALTSEVKPPAWTKRLLRTLVDVEVDA